MKRILILVVVAATLWACESEDSNTSNIHNGALSYCLVDEDDKYAEDQAVLNTFNYEEIQGLSYTIEGVE